MSRLFLGLLHRGKPRDLRVDLFPQKLASGKWLAPRVSARYAARYRKEAILNGTYGSYSPETGMYGLLPLRTMQCSADFELGAAGGWDPAWDKAPAAMVQRPPKGHKFERVREQRIATVMKNLEDMPTKLETFKSV